MARPGEDGVWWKRASERRKGEPTLYKLGAVTFSLFYCVLGVRPADRHGQRDTKKRRGFEAVKASTGGQAVHTRQQMWSSAGSALGATSNGAAAPMEQYCTKVEVKNPDVSTMGA